MREALCTALFRLRGPGVLVFSHRSYAEYLAALYLCSRTTALDQVKSLLQHPADAEGHVVPQLAGAAAWLGTMRPDLFDELVRIDPAIATRSELSFMPASSRAALVSSLLHEFDHENLLDTGLQLYRTYDQLRHPDLAQQLRPIIVDSQRGWLVRRVAIDIAEATGCTELQGDLLKVALDKSEHGPTRVQASYALGRIGDANTKVAMLGLLDPDEDDSDDELRGCALRALWPRLISAAEVFKKLSPVKRPILLGAYRAFLVEELPRDLTVEDLPVALEWVGELGPLEYTDPFEDLVEAIVLKGLEAIDVPPVLDSLAEVIAKKVLDDQGWWSQVGWDKFLRVLSGNTRSRLALLERVVPLISHEDAAWERLRTSRLLLCSKDDLTWLLQKLDVASAQPEQVVWAKLIAGTFDQSSSDAIDAVLAGRQRNTILREETDATFNPMDLDSEEATRLRQRYQDMLESEERHRALRQVQEPKVGNLLPHLEDFERGSTSSWLKVDFELARSDPDPDATDPARSDLSRSALWDMGESTLRGRLTSAAKQYLDDGDPNAKDWLGTDRVGTSALAGYRALRLLSEHAPDTFAGLPTDVWKKWAAIVVAFPVTLGNEDLERPHVRLVAAAYAAAPAQVTDALLRVIDKEGAESDCLFILRKFFSCWDDELAARLLEKAESASMRPGALRSLLKELLERETPGARTHAELLVARKGEPGERFLERAVAAAQALVTSTNDAGWQVVWPAIAADAAFGEAVLEECLYHSGLRSALPPRLSESQLGDLYIWLERHYPGPTIDEDQDEAAWLSPQDSARMAKLDVLGELKRRGTAEVVETLERLQHELPHLDWLKWHVLEARTAWRASTWQPPTPQQLVSMARSTEARFVRNADELVMVVLESLRRLEQKLQGETPLARSLWNEKPYRPKDESALSDLVRGHLRDDLTRQGVVANREVQIRPPLVAGSGEQVDIHIDGVCACGHGRQHDIVSAIIEVKGNWHPKLKTEMADQLVGRYLVDNPGIAGIYLVGWFSCPQWDQNDRRCSQARQFSNIDEAREFFEDQAGHLCSSLGRVTALVINTALRPPRQQTASRCLIE